MNEQSECITDALSAGFLAQFRQRAPLVHCMTNEVVQSFTANVLLALGGAPAMIIDPEEAARFSALADSLLINVGTLTRERAEAMLAAVKAANAAHTPWTLDPVAVGELSLRTMFCQQLLSMSPAAIRANASEIMALGQQGSGGRGVDAQHDSASALAAARQLAAKTGAVVVVTGEVDYITDGQRVQAVAGGDAMMTRLTGTGCALSAVVAAFCALPGDRLLQVACACRLYGLAGEQAAARSTGPGSFLPAFLDALYNLTPKSLS